MHKKQRITLTNKCVISVFKESDLDISHVINVTPDELIALMEAHPDEKYRVFGKIFPNDADAIGGDVLKHNSFEFEISKLNNFCSNIYYDIEFKDGVHRLEFSAESWCLTEPAVVMPVTKYDIDKVYILASKQDMQHISFEGKDIIRILCAHFFGPEFDFGKVSKINMHHYPVRTEGYPDHGSDYALTIKYGDESTFAMIKIATGKDDASDVMYITSPTTNIQRVEN